MSVTVLLGEDHPVVVEGLKSFFKDHQIELTSVATTVESLREKVLTRGISVVVTEHRLRGEDALGCLSEMTAKALPLPPIIFFSGDDSLTPLARAAAMSAYEFVDKSEDVPVLVKAIQDAAAGRPVDEARPIRQRRVQMTATKGNFSKNSPLTKREIQVLRHVSMGLSNREIGMSLGISVETTKEHVQNILRKLDVNDRTHAAIWALRRDLV